MINKMKLAIATLIVALAALTPAYVRAATTLNDDLTADVTVSDELIIPSGAAIDLKGHNLTLNGTLTVQGTATITNSDTGDCKDVTLKCTNNLTNQFQNLTFSGNLQLVVSGSVGNNNGFQGANNTHTGGTVLDGYSVNGVARFNTNNAYGLGDLTLKNGSKIFLPSQGSSVSTVPWPNIYVEGLSSVTNQIRAESGMTVTGIVHVAENGTLELKKAHNGTLAFNASMEDVRGNLIVGGSIVQFNNSVSLENATLEICSGTNLRIPQASQTDGKIAVGALKTPDDIATSTTSARLINTTDNRTLELVVGSLNADTVFYGDISNDNSKNNKDIKLEKVGTGTLTLGGENKYLGETVISAGAIRLVGSGRLGGESNTSSVIFNGGELIFGEGVMTDPSARLKTNSGKTAKIGVDAGVAAAIAGTPNTCADFEKTRAGTLVVTNGLAHTGTTKISAGAIRVKPGVTLGTGSLTISSGARVEVDVNDVFSTWTPNATVELFKVGSSTASSQFTSANVTLYGSAITNGMCVYNFTIDDEGQVRATYSPGALEWGGANGDNWDTTTEDKWYVGDIAYVYNDGQDVAFTDRFIDPATTNDVNVAEDVAPKTITVDMAGSGSAYNLTGSGKITTDEFNIKTNSEIIVSTELQAADFLNNGLMTYSTTNTLALPSDASGTGTIVIEKKGTALSSEGGYIKKLVLSSSAVLETVGLKAEEVVFPASFRVRIPESQSGVRSYYPVLFVGETNEVPASVAVNVLDAPLYKGTVTSKGILIYKPGTYDFNEVDGVEESTQYDRTNITNDLEVVDKVHYYTNHRLDVPKDASGSSGSLTLRNGTILDANDELQIAIADNSTGTVSVVDGAILNVGKYAAIAHGSNSYGELLIDGGKVNVAGDFYLNRHSGTGADKTNSTAVVYVANGILDIKKELRCGGNSGSDGKATINIADDGEVVVSGTTYVGYSSGAKSALDILGGSVQLNDALYLNNAEDADAVLSISNRAQVVVSKKTYFGKLGRNEDVVVSDGSVTINISGEGTVFDSGSEIEFGAWWSQFKSETINLDGGTLKVAGFRRTVAATGGTTINFNGGTFLAKSDMTFLAGEGMNYVIGEGGMIIDTDSHSVTIDGDYIKKAAGATEAVLIKKGAGTLTIADSAAGIDRVVLREGTIALPSTFTDVENGSGYLTLTSSTSGNVTTWTLVWSNDSIVAWTGEAGDNSWSNTNNWRYLVKNSTSAPHPESDFSGYGVPVGIDNMPNYNPGDINIYLDGLYNLGSNNFFDNYTNGYVRLWSDSNENAISTTGWAYIYKGAHLKVDTAGLSAGTIAVGNGSGEPMAEFTMESNSIVTATASDFHVGYNGTTAKFTMNGGLLRTAYWLTTSRGVAGTTEIVINDGEIYTAYRNGAFQNYNTGNGVLDIASTAGSRATFTINGGLVNAAGSANTGDKYQALKLACADSSYAELFINGGALNLYGTTVLAAGNSATGLVTVTGGALNMYDDAFIYAGGVLSVTNNGFVTCGTKSVPKWVKVNNGGTINLQDGGRLEVCRLTSVGGMNVNFDGGELVSYGGNGYSIGNIIGGTSDDSGTITLNVLAGGAIIETSGVDTSINAPLLNGTEAADGGLVKRGAGTLTLASGNTFNGPVRVEGGTLNLPGDFNTTSAHKLILAGGNVPALTDWQSVEIVGGTYEYSTISNLTSGTITLSGGSVVVDMSSKTDVQTGDEVILSKVIVSGTEYSIVAANSTYEWTLDATGENPKLIAGEVYTGTTNYWVGAGADNSWTTAANWMYGVPTATQTVYFERDAIVSHPHSETLSVASNIVINANVSLSGSWGFVVVNGDVTGTGTLTLGNYCGLKNNMADRMAEISCNLAVNNGGNGRHSYLNGASQGWNITGNTRVSGRFQFEAQPATINGNFTLADGAIVTVASWISFTDGKTLSVEDGGSATMSITGESNIRSDIIGNLAITCNAKSTLAGDNSAFTGSLTKTVNAAITFTNNSTSASADWNLKGCINLASDVHSIEFGSLQLQKMSGGGSNNGDYLTHTGALDVTVGAKGDSTITAPYYWYDGGSSWVPTSDAPVTLTKVGDTDLTIDTSGTSDGFTLTNLEVEEGSLTLVYNTTGYLNIQSNITLAEGAIVNMVYDGIPAAGRYKLADVGGTFTDEGAIAKVNGNASSIYFIAYEEGSLYLVVAKSKAVVQTDDKTITYATAQEAFDNAPSNSTIRATLDGEVIFDDDKYFSSVVLEYEGSYPVEVGPGKIISSNVSISNVIVSLGTTTLSTDSRINGILNIPEGSIVTITNSDIVAGITGMTGEGRFVAQGFNPATNTAISNSVQNVSKWTGTVQLNQIGNQNLSIDFANYGNTNSTVCANGLTGFLRFVANDTTEVGNVKCIDIGSGGLTLNNGFSYGTFGYIIAAKITGSGPMHFGTRHNDTSVGQYFLTGDMSEFTGVIDFGSLTSYRPAVIIKTPEEANPVVSDYGQIIVAAGRTNDLAPRIASAWTAPGGLVIYGEAKVASTGSITSDNGIAGSGKLIYEAFPTAAPTWCAGLTSSGTGREVPAWTGAVELPARNGSGSIALASFGVSGSKIVLNGITGLDANSIYLANSNEITATVELKGLLKLTNGSTGANYTFAEVTGEGNMFLSATGSPGSPYYTYTFTKLADYTGEINAVKTSDSKYAALAIGTVAVSSWTLGQKMVDLADNCNLTTSPGSITVEVNGSSLDNHHLFKAADGDLYVAVAYVVDGTTTNYYESVASAATAAEAANITTITALVDGLNTVEGWDYSDGTFTKNSNIARIDETEYDTLADAITAATTGENKTIVLFRASSENVMIPEGITVEVRDGVVFSGTVKGSGTIYYSAMPTTVPTFEDWTGTFVADWEGAQGTQFPANSYGNRGSVVEVRKLSGGYISGSNANVTILPTISIPENCTMKLNNGYSGKITTFSELTGAGKLEIASYTCYFTTISNFTGTISAASSLNCIITNIVTSVAVQSSRICVLKGGQFLNVSDILLNGEECDIAYYADGPSGEGLYAISKAYIVSNFGVTTNYYNVVSNAIEAAASGDVVYVPNPTNYVAPGSIAYTYAGDKSGVTIYNGGVMLDVQYDGATTTWINGTAYYWTGGGADNNWTTPANWGLTEGYPTNGCTAVFDVANATVAVSSAVTVGSIIASENVQIDMTANLNVADELTVVSGKRLCFNDAGETKTYPVVQVGDYVGVAVDTEDETVGSILALSDVILIPENDGSNLNIAGYVEVVEGTKSGIYGNGGSSATGTYVDVKGNLIGKGALYFRNYSNKHRAGVTLSGNNEEFEGEAHILMGADPDMRGSIGYATSFKFNGDNTGSSKATWYLSPSDTSGNNNFGSTTQVTKFGALIGEGTYKMLANCANKIILGNETDSTCGLSFQRTGGGVGMNIDKVGTGTITYTGNINDSGGYLSLQEGMMILDATNRQVKALSFDGGTLGIGENTGYDYSAVIMDNANAIASISVVNEAIDYVMATRLSSEKVAGLVKKGAGTLTLAKAPTYTGETVVEEGTLVVPIGTAFSGAVNVKSGAALAFAGDLAWESVTTNLCTFATVPDVSTLGRIKFTGLNSHQKVTFSVPDNDNTLVATITKQPLVWNGEDGDDWSAENVWLVNDEPTTFEDGDIVEFTDDSIGDKLDKKTVLISGEVAPAKIVTSLSKYRAVIFDGEGSITTENLVVEQSGEGIISLADDVMHGIDFSISGTLEVEAGVEGVVNLANVTPVGEGVKIRTISGTAIASGSINGITVENNSAIILKSTLAVNSSALITGAGSLTLGENGYLYQDSPGMSNFEGDIYLEASSRLRIHKSSNFGSGVIHFNGGTLDTSSGNSGAGSAQSIENDIVVGEGNNVIQNNMTINNNSYINLTGSLIGTGTLKLIDSTSTNGSKGIYLAGDNSGFEGTIEFDNHRGGYNPIPNDKFHCNPGFSSASAGSAKASWNVIDTGSANGNWLGFEIGNNNTIELGQFNVVDSTSATLYVKSTGNTIEIGGKPNTTSTVNGQFQGQSITLTKVGETSTLKLGPEFSMPSGSTININEGTFAPATNLVFDGVDLNFSETARLMVTLPLDEHDAPIEDDLVVFETTGNIEGLNNTTNIVFSNEGYEPTGAWVFYVENGTVTAQFREPIKYHWTGKGTGEESDFFASTNNWVTGTNAPYSVATLPPSGMNAINFIDQARSGDLVVDLGSNAWYVADVDAINTGKDRSLTFKADEGGSLTAKLNHWPGLEIGRDGYSTVIFDSGTYSFTDGSQNGLFVGWWWWDASPCTGIVEIVDAVVSAKYLELGRDHGRGFLNMTGNGSLNIYGDIRLGVETVKEKTDGSERPDQLPGEGYIDIQSGTLNVTGTTRIGRYVNWVSNDVEHNVYEPTYGRMTVGGGVVNSRDFVVGAEGGLGDLVITNGVLNSTATVMIGSSATLWKGTGYDTHVAGTGTVYQTGGELNVTNSYLALAHDEKSCGEYYMSGGTLSITGSNPALVVGRHGEGYFEVSGNANISAGNMKLGESWEAIPSYGHMKIGGGEVETAGDVDVGYRSLGEGYLEITNGNMTVGGYLNIGRETGSTGTVKIVGGTLTANGNLVVGRAGKGNMTISDDAQLITTDNLVVGELSSGLGVMEVSGGAATVGGTVYIGKEADSRGTFKISGGEMIASYVEFGDSSASSIGAFTMTGGVFQTRYFKRNDSVTAYLTFDGGVLQATQDRDNFFENITDITIDTENGVGLMFDTGANNITFANTTKFTGGGMFTKLGSGSLTFNDPGMPKSMNISLCLAGNGTLSAPNWIFSSVHVTNGTYQLSEVPMANEYYVEGKGSLRLDVADAVNTSGTNIVVNGGTLYIDASAETYEIGDVLTFSKILTNGVEGVIPDIKIVNTDLDWAISVDGEGTVKATAQYSDGINYWVGGEIGLWHDAYNWKRGIPTTNDVVTCVTNDAVICFTNNSSDTELDANLLAGTFAISNNAVVTLTSGVMSGVECVTNGYYCYNRLLPKNGVTGEGVLELGRCGLANLAGCNEAFEVSEGITLRLINEGSSSGGESWIEGANGKITAYGTIEAASGYSKILQDVEISNGVVRIQEGATLYNGTSLTMSGEMEGAGTFINGAELYCSAVMTDFAGTITLNNSGGNYSNFYSPCAGASNAFWNITGDVRFSDAGGNNQPAEFHIGQIFNNTTIRKMVVPSAMRLYIGARGGDSNITGSYFTAETNGTPVKVENFILHKVGTGKLVYGSYGCPEIIVESGELALTALDSYDNTKAYCVIDSIIVKDGGKLSGEVGDGLTITNLTIEAGGVYCPALTNSGCTSITATNVTFEDGALVEFRDSTGYAKNVTAKNANRFLILTASGTITGVPSYSPSTLQPKNGGGYYWRPAVRGRTMVIETGTDNPGFILRFR